MSWRSTQLGSSLCDQDQIILKLINNRAVQYIGHDLEFAKHLLQVADSDYLVLIINNPLWVSELLQMCKQYIADPINTFYIGINRYVIKGNDTTIKFDNTTLHGSDLINFISLELQKQGYITTKSGYFDNDQGRYFNFVQPQTWLYGNKNSN